jgi:hypothetical protein
VTKRRRFQQWSRDNKLALAGVAVGVIGVVVAIIAIIVPLITSSGSDKPTTIGTNNGQVNVGGTVYNGVPTTIWGDPDPGGRTVPGRAYTCTAASQEDSVRTQHLVAVTLFVRLYESNECFDASAAPLVTPSQVEFEIRYINMSKVIQHDVEFRIQLAKGLYLVPGTTYIMNSGYPKGQQLDTDAIADNGIVVGSYTPGATAFIAFEVDTPAIGDLHCGRNVLNTFAYVQPKGLDYFYNTADVVLTRPCPNSFPN